MNIKMIIDALQINFYRTSRPSHPNIYEFYFQEVAGTKKSSNSY